MGDTSISWTDKTWNPIRGCSRVSAGCQHCYAERQASRFAGEGQAFEGLVKIIKRDVRQFKEVNGQPTGEFRTIARSEPHWTGEVRFVAEHLADPLRWRKPQRVFVNSMSDLFHEKLTNEQIAAVFGVMAAAPQHTFQVLTKRAKRMREWFEWASDFGPTALYGYAEHAIPTDDDQGRMLGFLRVAKAWPAPLPNVWLGVSVENQDAADERIPELLDTPAAVRFLSCEPLLDELCLEDVRPQRDGKDACSIDALRVQEHLFVEDGWSRNRIDWVIAGCESGPGARPCDVAWLRSLRDQCAAAGVPYFLKQAKWHGDDVSGIAPAESSRRKAGGVIELPYLDGVQHAAFPESDRG